MNFSATWMHHPVGAAFVHPLMVGMTSNNHAESHHSRLRHAFGHPHPVLGEWLVINRELLHSDTKRALDVRAGRREPNQPLALYEKIHGEMRKARLTYNGFLVSRDTESEEDEERFKRWTLRFLGVIGRLMGIKPSTPQERTEDEGEQLARVNADNLLRNGMQLELDEDDEENEEPTSDDEMRVDNDIPSDVELLGDD